METKRIKRAFYTALITVAISLGIIALALLGQTAQDSEEFGRLHDALLLVNASAAVVLLVLIIGNLIRLWRDYRRKAPGAKLKTRMLAAIVGLAAAPLVVVYMFAVQYLNRGIDTWFDVQIENGLSDALTLSRSAFDRTIQTSMERTQRIATGLITADPQELVITLNELRREAGATEVTLFGDHYLIVATSVNDQSMPFPAVPPEDVIQQLHQAGSYVGIDPSGDGRYQVRAALVLPGVHLNGQTLTLQAVYPVGERIGALVDSVQNTYTRYNELVFLREPLKYSFALTLTLVVLLSILASVYGAFFFARRLVEPILSVVAGTRAVAQGEFDTRLPIATHDEVGFLIDSFNQMIQRLSAARATARLSQDQAEKERIRVEAILARLSTGVIALESDGRIRIANEAASAILNADLTHQTGEPLSGLAATYPILEEFLHAIQPYLDSEETDWREQVVIHSDTGRRVLVCASTGLPGLDGSAVEPLGGSVLVFDDVTNLLQAQRDAAWGEVARRLAHEIKNPLTPIQLSAERIRRRYLGNMKDMEAEVLDRATHTIVTQVEAMRDMVNAFSDYARAPEMNFSRFDLNRLIREVSYLYRSQDDRPAIRFEMDESLGDIEADDVRIRQLLHNLIRNAMEAMEGQDGGELLICTQSIIESDRGFAEIRVRDNGPGIDPEMMEKLFEPYATTKTKGTGLGLAIVKKLVEEHGGSVLAENLEGGGTGIIVRLPLLESTRDGGDHHVGSPGERRQRA
jgi:nitrogen fixation/metabolism regulation signal transduction histidine kinase